MLDGRAVISARLFGVHVTVTDSWSLGDRLDPLPRQGCPVSHGTDHKAFLAVNGDRAIKSPRCARSRVLKKVSRI